MPGLNIYYVVIAAHRYGSLDGKVSFTEKEYNYAVEKKVPTLGFILDDNAEWPITLVEQDIKAKKSLARFKLKIREKPVGFWKTPEELNAKVSIALMKTFITSPRSGWSRVTASVGPEVTNELSRLSVENAQLREMNEKLVAAEETERQRREEVATVLPVLKKNLFPVSIRFLGDTGWTVGPTISLDEIFNVLALYMLVDGGAKRMARLLATTYAQSTREGGGKLSKDWPIARNTLFMYLSSLKALNLIELSTKPHTDDDDVYWSLTKTGERVQNAVLLRRLEDADRSVSEGEQIDLNS